MYYTQCGQFYGPNTIPQPGDQIFFTYSAGEVSHTGIVEVVSGRSITCIEFNTSDQVARRYYTVGQSCIYGYGRPDWGMDGGDEQDDPKEGEVVIIVDPPAGEDTDVPATPATDTDVGGKTYKIELPYLRQGMVGSRVEAAQVLLIHRGYGCGGKIRNGVEKADGEFGPKTKQAVMQFQKANALTVDGEIGPQTMSALL